MDKISLTKYCINCKYSVWCNNRLLFYGWSVGVTAYARHNLWEAILESGKDFVYSDTDSIIQHLKKN